MAINLWVGHGAWEGWTLRKHYNGCKFGDSVLVDPNGNSYGPTEILELRNIYENIKDSEKSKRVKE